MDNLSAATYIGINFHQSKGLLLSKIVEYFWLSNGKFWHKKMLTSKKRNLDYKIVFSEQQSTPQAYSTKETQRT